MTSESGCCAGPQGGGRKAESYEVIIELHHIMELTTDCSKRNFQILECLHRLLAKIAAELAFSIVAQLTGDIDESSRSNDFDHVRVARRLAQCSRIDETSLAQDILLLNVNRPIMSYFYALGNIGSFDEALSRYT